MRTLLGEGAPAACHGDAASFHGLPSTPVPLPLPTIRREPVPAAGPGGPVPIGARTGGAAGTAGARAGAGGATGPAGTAPGAGGAGTATGAGGPGGGR